MITLRVVGEPAPQGSKARGRNGGLYEMSSKKLKPWRAAILAAMGDSYHAPIRGPVWAEITFVLPRPAMHYGTGRNAAVLRKGAPPRPLTRPDLDKLTRAMLDTLKIGGAYADDGMVTDLMASKRYARYGEDPGAYVTLQEAES